jgi:hypothetical protein
MLKEEFNVFMECYPKAIAENTTCPKNCLAIPYCKSAKSRHEVYKKFIIGNEKIDYKDNKINNPAKLAFDPKTSKDKMIRKVFRSKISSTLWASIKQVYLADQYFNEKILDLSKAIGRKKHSISEFSQIINSFFYRIDQRTIKQVYTFLYETKLEIKYG